MQIPTQTTQSTRSRRRAVQSFDNPVKLAYDKLPVHQKQGLLKNFYMRKQLLTIPDEILGANPDKYFVWISMNDLQKNGMFHPMGYKLFKGQKDSETTKDIKFDDVGDGYIHRNEMVLAYLPMEDHLEREMEKMAAREERDLTTIISNNSNLSGFQATGTETVESYTVKATPKVKNQEA